MNGIKQFGRLTIFVAEPLALLTVGAAAKDGKGRGEESRSKDRPLQLPAGGAFGLDGLTLADFGRADFVGGGVAGALEGAPHVPTGDGAVGAPAFAEGEEFFGLGHVFFTVGYGPAFLYAEVVDGEDVGAAEAFDEFFVGESLGLLERGDDAIDGFLREVFHGEDLCAGETGFPEEGLSQL